MSDYRIYVLDPMGRIRLGYDFQGRDDLSALDESKKYSRKGGIEIWQHSRLVARIGQGAEAATG